MSFERWLLFSFICISASLTPGPAVLLVTTHSIAHGASRALATIAGNVSGLFMMALTSVLGIGLIISHSLIAMSLIRVGGALYLVYLGIRLCRFGITLMPPDPIARTAVSRWVLYRRGIMLALTNPKAILFTAALFPQFIEPTRPLASQFAVLVMTFMSGSFLCLTGYACLGAYLGHRCSTPRWHRWSGYGMGALFIGCGLALLKGVLATLQTV